MIRRKRLDFIRVFVVAGILRETVTQAFLRTDRVKFPTSRLLASVVESWSVHNFSVASHWGTIVK